MPGRTLVLTLVAVVRAGFLSAPASLQTTKRIGDDLTRSANSVSISASRWSVEGGSTPSSTVGSNRQMGDGNDGIGGNAGLLESATYRFHGGGGRFESPCAHDFDPFCSKHLIETRP